MQTTSDLELLGHGLCIEDLAAGRRFRTLGRTVTDADITLFVGATGMVEDLFTDLEYAARASAIKGRLAPGALVFSIADALVLQASAQRTGLAFLEMSFEIKGATLSGDTIHVVVEVVESRASSNPEWGIVKTRNEVMNQKGETVMIYCPVRLMRTRAGIAGLRTEAQTAPPSSVCLPEIG